MVVDAVVCQWGFLGAEGDGGDSSKNNNNNNNNTAQPASRTIRSRYEGRRWMEDGHTRLKVKELFLYAYDGMVASTNPGWLQTAFYTLTGLFGQVGLKKKIRETWVWSATHSGWPGYG